MPIWRSAKRHLLPRAIRAQNPGVKSSSAHIQKLSALSKVHDIQKLDGMGVGFEAPVGGRNKFKRSKPLAE